LAAVQVISAIDGVPTMGLRIADCVRRIQGKAGTKVFLEIEDLRHNWTNSIEVTRNVVEGDLLAVNPDAFNIPLSERRLSLSVTTNQVVLVWGTNGTITIIQFTEIGTTNANCRWRSSSASGGVVTIGAGVVFEDYDRQIDACGRIQLTHDGSSDDLYVKAGGVRLEWSSSNLTHSWLYYYPLREKVEVLDLSSFDSDFK
jgi:hypothetical protein